MIPTAGKFWFTVAALAFVGGIVYVVAAGSEWFGTFVLMSVAASGLLLGGLSVATRDGDGPVYATQPVEMVPIPSRRSLAAPWPVLFTVAIAVAIIGLAGHSLLFWAGLGMLVLVFGEWMVQDWAEGVSSDDAANQELRNRLMFPLEIPTTAMLIVAFVVLSFSRVLLALPKNASTVVAIVVAITILGVASLIAARPQLSSSIVTAVIVVVVLVFLIAGIVGGISGHRTFHEEKSEGLNGASAQEINTR